MSRDSRKDKRNRRYHKTRIPDLVYGLIGQALGDDQMDTCDEAMSDWLITGTDRVNGRETA